MKTYRAFKELSIDMYDADGSFTEESRDIPVGSIWEPDVDSWRLIGGEIRLLSIVGSPFIGWIEIDIETLEKYFEKVED